MAEGKYHYGTELFHSAREHFKAAVEFLSADEEHSHSFGILHIAIALELLAKARLASKDLQLIVRGRRKPTDAEFRIGAFQSIGIEEAFESLETLGLAHLDDSQRFALTSIRNLRNSVVHFLEQTGRLASLEPVFGAASLFLDIHELELADWRASDVFPRLNYSLNLLTRMKGFVPVRMAALRSKLVASMRPCSAHMDECYQCLQDAATISGEDIVCLYCGASYAVHIVAEEMSRDRSVSVCPQCALHSIIACTQCRPDTISHECFCCGYSVAHPCG